MYNGNILSILIILTLRPFYPPAKHNANHLSLIHFKRQDKIV